MAKVSITDTNTQTKQENNTWKTTSIDRKKKKMIREAIIDGMMCAYIKIDSRDQHLHGHHSNIVVPGQDPVGHLGAQLLGRKLDIAESLEEASGLVAKGSDHRLLVHRVMISGCVLFMAGG